MPLSGAPNREIILTSNIILLASAGFNVMLSLRARHLRVPTLFLMANPVKISPRRALFQRRLHLGQMMRFPFLNSLLLTRTIGLSQSFLLSRQLFSLRPLRRTDLQPSLKSP